MELIDFLKDKEKVNPRSKLFLYHGTNVIPKDFKIKDEYEGEDQSGHGVEIPLGYLFLTTDVKEASAYGKYIIPRELKYTDHISFTINRNNPSQVFDNDYDGITNFNMWGKFDESGKSVLIIKGNRKKWTVITYGNNVIPRTDLAQEFYNL